MKYPSPKTILLFFMVISCNFDTKKQEKLPQKKVTDNYYGVEIQDPYRYLENTKDSSLLSWYEEQENYTKSLIKKILTPENLLIKEKKIESKNSVSTSLLKITNNDFYFYSKNDAENNLSKLYIKDGFNGKEKLIFDINSYKPKNGNEFIINYISPSWDGSKVVISITKNDEEISEMLIFDVHKKTILPQVIDHCWPSALGGIDWLPDNSGFTYVHIPIIDKKNENYILNTASVLYKIGDDPKKLDILLSKNNNPNLNIKSEDFPIVYVKDENSKFLFGRIGGARSNDDYYISEANIDNLKIKWKLLYKKEDKIGQFHIYGEDIIFLTTKEAPNYKICKTSLLNPNFDSPEVLVVENSNNGVITDFALTKKGIFYTKIKNGVDAKLFHYFNDTIKNIPLPKPSGFIELFSKNGSYEDVWIEIRGWTFEKERYYYKFNDHAFLNADLYPTSEYEELKNVIIEEIEIKSYDGVMVPLSIIYKKDTKLNSENRILISGYGSYGFSDVPHLDKYLVNWVKKGGIYALAHVRGGGEKGEAWHKGGYKTTKPNTWKDFIACTEYLIDKKYTSSDKTAIWSASAGGILIGRAITERPDLYAAAIIKNGKLNMLRSEFGINGLNNTKEFGTVKDSIEFNALLEMDSYHHIKDGEKYPATYITAGINDARVAVWEPSKFAARLQAANSSSNPILLSVDFKGGHGLDANEDKSNEELNNTLAFALWQTGHPDYQLDK